jgi:hypothetical protein
MPPFASSSPTFPEWMTPTVKRATATTRPTKRIPIGSSQGESFRELSCGSVLLTPCAALEVRLGRSYRGRALKPRLQEPARLCIGGWSGVVGDAVSEVDA